MDKFIETTDKKFIENHATEIWDIMERSYSNIGVFLTYEKIDEMINRISLLRYGINRNNDIVAAAIYDNRKGGEKLVGCGTLNGTQEEKEIIYNIVLNDAERISQWHWAEVSGAMERIFQKSGGSPIPSEIAQIVLETPYSNIKIDDDSHYYRLINGEFVRKIMYGFKDEETYNNVMNSFSKLTGFEKYEDWKKYTNSKEVKKLLEWEDDSTYDRIKFCLNTCDRFVDLMDDYNIYEIPKAYHDFISAIYKEVTEKYMLKRSVVTRKPLLNAVKFELSFVTIIPEGNMKETMKKITAPILGNPKRWAGYIKDF